MQKTATFAWRAFERYRFGNAKKVRFKRRGAPITIENKSNATGLRLKSDKVLWGGKHTRTLEFPIIVKRNDTSVFHPSCEGRHAASQETSVRRRKTGCRH